MQISYKDTSVLHHSKHKEHTDHLHFKNSSDYDLPMNVGFINEALRVKEVLVSDDRGQKMRWSHVTRNLWMPRLSEWTGFLGSYESHSQIEFMDFPSLWGFFICTSSLPYTLTKNTFRDQCMTQSCCLNTRSVKWTQSSQFCHGNNVYHRPSLYHVDESYVVFAKISSKTFTMGIVCKDSQNTHSEFNVCSPGCVLVIWQPEKS